MIQSIEKATFQNISLKSVGKFEIPDAGILLVSDCRAPFGVELDSVYNPLPMFAGGKDPRRYLAIQLEITQEQAEGFVRLDAE